MAKVRHLLHGIVRLNMRGTSPERFLNLCTLAGLNVWQVKKEIVSVEFGVL
ncbi:sporulation protein YqfD [uncultured Clostridium sp.]|uniref:sporulation protein YqfD n=1 Tax=uncultured Clostridium sp. TaxID=59620 RepID=UPI00266BB0A7|nr:sporulation protein YqfD [uncultured Clostridium sp.]